METGKKMDMEQFAESIKERLEQQGQFEVNLKQVLKNNGVVRYGLMLCRSGDNLAPTFYMEPLFDAYRDGSADMEKIVREILEAYESTPSGDVDMSFFREFSTVKERLCMKLVNREANVEFLAGAPYREFLDMAVAYYVDCYDPGIGSGTIRISNSHMEMWGVTEEELWKAASRNTPERKPGRIEDMDDVLAGFFAGDGGDGIGDSGCSMKESPVQMLVLTNADRVYGAAVILYSGILKQAADKAGSDLFILPASVHEVIAVPVNGEREAAEFKEMVMEVNRKEVKPEEVLSDNVYIYRREQDRLEIA